MDIGINLAVLENRISCHLLYDPAVLVNRIGREKNSDRVTGLIDNNGRMI